ncbi:MAG: CRISPR-associated endonuclease Cas2 [Deltaproteobacteria bacterium]|nr:CRISPR-associated endonuclease Cas2 [Deltaproteobacteria bacterium]
MKQTETLVWIIYDISVDKKRGRVAKLCKEAGLYRVQKSVFLGTIERNRLDELLMQVEGLIDTVTDSVYAFPLCQPDFKKVITLGQAFDEKLVNDEVRMLFA